MQRALNSWESEFATDDRACVEVVQAFGAAQRVDVDMAFFVAREAVGAAFGEQRLEAQFVAGGFGDGVHGGLLGANGFGLPLGCAAERSGSSYFIVQVPLEPTRKQKSPVRLELSHGTCTR